MKSNYNERSVGTFLKTTTRNHMQLSSMADSKAHILLSINSIIISILISMVGKKLEQTRYLIIPTGLLLCICLVSIVFSVLATQPKVSNGVFTKDQVRDKEANLFFFGNFHKMDMKTFNWAVREVMTDNSYLYNSMTRDIYCLGKVASRCSDIRHTI